MKLHTAMLTLAAVALVVAGCAKDSPSGKQEVSQVGKTKLVKIGDIQTSFEVMDSTAHQKMAKDMKMKKMSMDKKSSHYILLSVMDKKNRVAVKNLKVSVELTAPGKKTVKKETHTMEGMGMYHYAAGFDMQKSGEYAVKAIFSIGDRVYEPATKVTVGE